VPPSETEKPISRPAAGQINARQHGRASSLAYHVMFFIFSSGFFWLVGISQFFYFLILVFLVFRFFSFQF
jgi:hypothetical protein